MAEDNAMYLWQESEFDFYEGMYQILKRIYEEKGLSEQLFQKSLYTWTMVKQNIFHEVLSDLSMTHHSF